MIITENTTLEDPSTGVDARIFPAGFGELFQSVSPTTVELISWSRDAGVLSAAKRGKEIMVKLPLGKSAVNQLPDLIGLRLYDWANAQQQRIYEQATNIGLVREEDLQALAASANAVVSALASVRSTDPAILAEDLAKRTIFEFYSSISGLIATYGGPYAALAVSVIGFCAQISNLFVELGKAPDEARSSLPILIASDLQAADQQRVRQLRSEMAASRDWSWIATPATDGDFGLYEVGSSRPADLGWILARGDDEEVGVGMGAGFLPGTSRTLTLMQLTSSWKSVRDHYDDRGREALTATHASHYCDPTTQEPGDVGAPCFIEPDNFRGKVSCRQCIPIHSITGGRGDWRETLNAFESIAVSVGDWSINASQSYAALWDGLTVSNPSTWCFDLESIARSWRDYYAGLFEFIPSAWDRHDAYAWRAMVSNLAAWAITSNEDGRIAGRGTLLDWRVEKWGEYDKGVLGDRAAGVPPVYSGYSKEWIEGVPERIRRGLSPGITPWNDKLALQAIHPTPFLFKNSVWSRAISPALDRLAQTQLAGYETDMIAYLWEDQGAHWDGDTGKLRSNVFGEAYEASLRAVLDSSSLRARIHMEHVADPKIRKLLLDAGASPFQTGAQIQAGEAAKRGARRVLPKTPVLAAFSPDWIPPPPAMPPMGGLPSDPFAAAVAPRASTGWRAALTLLGGAAVGLAAFGWRSRR